ncbi:unnamed protein product [Rotaria sp. Silwood1]|nr:unnamed protein product [Rotaria sp. Silwood1]
MQKNHQHLVRPCAVLVERLNDTFIPSKRYKVDADIIYRPLNDQITNTHDELSVDVLMLPNNKVKISSSSTFDDLSTNESPLPPSTTTTIINNDDIKPIVRIRPHQSSIDSIDYDITSSNKRLNTQQLTTIRSSNKYDNDSYLFNGTFDSDDELGMDLNDDELASIHRVLDFDDDDMSNFDDDNNNNNNNNTHLQTTTGPGYHPAQLPDLVMGSLRADNDIKFEPSFQYSDLFNRKGRTFVCDERGNRVVSVKLDKNSAKHLIDSIERNLGRLILEECRRGDLQAHILKVVFKDEQEFFDFNRSAIVSKHSFKQCPEMYTRFLESLFESQSYPNDNENDPLGTDDFQNHIYSHSSQTNKFQCNLCPYNCKSFSKLKRHMLYHQGQRNYECPKCNNKFYQMEHLKRHLTSIHKLNIPQIGRGNRLFGSDLLKRNSDMPNIPPPHGTVPQCYKVISKCVFTCQKCPFSTTKLYHLNEHVKSEHLQLDDSAHVCTFCSYITDKKTNLKRHLHHNHAGQSNTPVLLSNDALLSNPNTKFQCGLCRRYQSNVDEFIKHITEKHRMDVVILDSANNGNIHQQIKSRGRAELICASNNTTPFRFDEYGGLVTVMKNSGTTNELNTNQTTINDPTNSSSTTNSTTDFLLPQ